MLVYSLTEEKLVQIDSGYFCAGLVFDKNHIISIAPVIGYMKKNDWTLTQVQQYCIKKKWKLIFIE
jgi:hypothetical protein